jgi:subtilisin family serine protease
MRTSWPRLLLVGALLASAASTCATAAGGTATTRVVVGYSPAGYARAAELETIVGGTRLAAIPKLHADVLAVGDVEAAFAFLRAQPEVRYAELDGTVTALRVPNDALLSTQWSVATTHAEQAWDLSTGSATVVVAVVDTGVDATQPDLQGKVLPGYDYVNGDSDPSDDNGHGTAVAGVTAAAADNRIGVAGYCWQCRLLPVKVLGSDGSGFDSDLAQGVVWATDHGARIVNLSLGGPSEDAVLTSAAQYAYAHGALLVAAAGNESLTTLDYPAALPTVLSVGASDRNDRLYSFSNQSASVAAPGENSTTGRGSGFVTFLGTSSAAPVVSGIAGLLLGRDASMTVDQVRSAIESSAQPIAGVTHGRVDAYGALRALGTLPLSPPPAPPPPPSAAHPPAMTTGGTATITRVWAGRLTARRRSRAVALTTAAGAFRAVVRLRRPLRVRLRLVAGRRIVATASGVGGAGLRATVVHGRYRLLLGAAGRKAVAYRLTVSYRPAS